MRLFAGLFWFVLALFSTAGPSWSQDENETFDFWLSEAHVRRLADENTINFRLRLSLNHRTKTVHVVSKDCEIHIAASSAEQLAWPAAVVVEPPNVCKERAPGMPKTSETQLRDKLWPEYLDRNMMDKECEVVGFPRIYTEHAAGNTDPANPDHVLEIHPALAFTCGTFKLDMRSFLKAYSGMSRIKNESAASCIESRKLAVRKRNNQYEFKQDGGANCGNFAILYASIYRQWVRKINGGHSAIARVSPAGRGPYTLKLYTYEGTPEDKLLQDISERNGPQRRLYFHGMFTYDYFSIVKVLRDRDGNWHNVSSWTEVPFPLAFVIFGETKMEEEED